jgi:serine/threonine-protein kinase HipA
VKVEVHTQWRGHTHRVGRLWSGQRTAREYYSFEYDPSWLESPVRFAIDPASLPLRTGAFHSRRLFGAIADGGPDRWGRLLIQRALRKRLIARRMLGEIEYLIELDDVSRIGSLRYREGPDLPFLAARAGQLPPMVALPMLLRAADAVERDRESAADLRHLLGFGSPVGGARPKSVVVDGKGNLSLAKFPKPDDTRDMGAGEILALKLAHTAGLRVAESQRISVHSRSVALIRRFDRAGSERLPFISAATLLALEDDSRASYTLLADAIRRFGGSVAEDLEELWRRMVFSLLVSNCDDHARNHGFLLSREHGWVLSPAYDINPVPWEEQPAEWAMTVTESVAEPATSSSIEEALRVLARFNLSLRQARRVLRRLVKTVSAWREEARAAHIPKRALEAYTSAFETERLRIAARECKA